MNNISKITSVLLYVLMGISVILLIMFAKATAGIEDGTDFDTQISLYGSTLDMFMYWAYILLGIATAAAIIFPLIKMFTQPKEAVKTLISIGIVAVVVFIAYALADDTVLNLPGYEGKDNVPGTLKFAGTLLNTAYLLITIAIGSILYDGISKVFK